MTRGTGLLARAWAYRSAINGGSRRDLRLNRAGSRFFAMIADHIGGESSWLYAATVVIAFRLGHRTVRGGVPIQAKRATVGTCLTGRSASDCHPSRPSPPQGLTRWLSMRLRRAPGSRKDTLRPDRACPPMIRRPRLWL